MFGPLSRPSELVTGCNVAAGYLPKFRDILAEFLRGAVTVDQQPAARWPRLGVSIPLLVGVCA